MTTTSTPRRAPQGPRTFRLAALLRLRTLQEDDALAGLGRARQELASAAAGVTAAREAVRATGPAPAAPTTVFLAAVASRAALAAAVSDAVTLERAAQREVELARDAWQDARGRARAVGRLADRQTEQERIDLARREQAEADELASARWTRPEGTR